MQRDYLLDQMAVLFGPREKNSFGLIYVFTLLVLENVPVVMVVLGDQENQAVYKEDEN